ncbi:ankyrin repeat domain-containing protein 39 isoform X2 [Salvelinus sp. IW2-2015]|uniref:ankyrin repeat domain-containing protein 39 isoform X2 n=1 Tax=Salvelinus sp. IW2-2015 TaxID=2691554 RepID=UPI000CDFEA9E|nr:ankyrin repeat domain-containing protein 39 isoform X2 [Salvelinus alpinus]
MSSGGHQCNVRCCSHQLASPSAHQTLDEMDFERGIWSAAMDGDLERVKSLLKKGTDPNLRDSANYTALHYASRSGHKSVCKFLLESGACANPQTPGGATPLHRSAYCGQLDVVQLLLHHGADPQLCDGDGSSPLHKVWSLSSWLLEKLSFHLFSTQEPFPGLPAAGPESRAWLVEPEVIS